jgi:hypothetical protein
MTAADRLTPDQCEAIFREMIRCGDARGAASAPRRAATWRPADRARAGRFDPREDRWLTR